MVSSLLPTAASRTGGVTASSAWHEVLSISAALAATRIEEQHLAGLREAYAVMGRSRTDPEAYIEADLDFHLSLVQEVALVGEQLDELAGVVRPPYHPHLVLAGGPEGTAEPPLMRGRSTVEGRPASEVARSSRT